MPETVTREEFQQLGERVDSLEKKAGEERTLSRYILEQTQANLGDLADLTGRFVRFEARVETKFAAMTRANDGMGVDGSPE